MENPVVLLLIGIVVGVLLGAKSIREVLYGLPPLAYAYILLGLVLFGATWILQVWGLAAVLVAYGLYQVVGRRAQGLGDILSYPWFGKRKKEAEVAPDERIVPVDVGPKKSEPPQEPAE